MVERRGHRGKYQQEGSWADGSRERMRSASRISGVRGIGAVAGHLGSVDGEGQEITNDFTTYKPFFDEMYMMLNAVRLVADQGMR
jgi:hypothetical protein